MAKKSLKYGGVHRGNSRQNKGHASRQVCADHNNREGSYLPDPSRALGDDFTKYRSGRAGATRQSQQR